MSTARNILVVSHAAQQQTLEAAIAVCRELVAQGATPVLREIELDPILKSDASLSDLPVLDKDIPITDIECAIVVGGDGTILRAAELLRGVAVPMLGVNLGHVGFLAETEPEGISDTVRHVLAKEYEVEERSTLSVSVHVGSKMVFESWALNEVTVEKASRERMLEVVIEVDHRPLSSFGCDGVVMSTPTGSTAYSFSAGGPIVWPDVQAMVVVPLSAHSLFARPLVISPESTVAVEILERRSGHGVLWCDGRRTRNLPPGARVVVGQSDTPVLLAQLHKHVFTDRLVTKFNLPVTGWRGPTA